jgi:palmitoyl-protein thioesterase
VNVLVSIGGQHQGVYGFPKCPGGNSYFCDAARRLLNMGAYLGIVQNRLVQAVCFCFLTQLCKQYWHDPFQRQRYLENNIFLPNINNEIEGRRNEEYKKNLMKLKKFILVRFTKDSMVEPIISVRRIH